MRRLVRIVTIVITILVVYCTYQIAVGGPLSSTFAAIFAGVSLIISIYQVISELRRSLQNKRPRESRVIVPGVQRGRRARSRIPVLARLREGYELLLTRPLFYRPQATPLIVPDHYVQGKIRQRNLLVLKMTGLVLLALINAGSLGIIVSYVSSVQQGSCVVLTEKVTQVELSNYDSITNTNTSYTEYTFLFSFRLHTRDGQVYSVSQDDTGLRMQASESYGYTSFEEAERLLPTFTWDRGIRVAICHLTYRRSGSRQDNSSQGTCIRRNHSDDERRKRQVTRGCELIARYHLCRFVLFKRNKT